jgi:transcriptional regulator with XRE-family HTH domain
MSEQKESLGALIRRLRKEKGLTQAALGEAIGVGESYISKIEADKLSYTPSEETLRLAAKVLETDPLHLLALAEKAPEEMRDIVKSEQAREFFNLVRTSRVSSNDWQDLTDTLRHRLSSRGGGSKR